eukprot:s542_g13.t1
MAPKKGADAKAKAAPAPKAKAPEKDKAPKAAAKPAAKSAAAEKVSRRQAKEREEAEKQATIDAMMNPECDEEEDEDEEVIPEAAGNFRPAERNQKEAAEISEAMREELRRQREEKAQLREAERLEKAESKGKSAAKDLQAVLEKVAKEGEGKLSNKERRVYAKYLEKQKEEAEEQEQRSKREELGDEVAQLDEDLRAFSVSLPSGSTAAAGAVDLHLERFSISAGGQRLFDDASLRLSKGRHYGLLGPNGMGKTTLLKHLAARKLPVPEHWSVTLVQQEAEATEVHVVDEVIGSDLRRRQLLQREAELLSKLESQAEAEVDAAELQKLCDELNSVAQDLEAAGAEAAEARVRKILCGLGFSNAMIDGPVNVLSGGWRMRVSLAKALFLEPDLLLLDEPTNHLDLDAVIWLDEYLNDYPKTLLVVSHDADFLDSVCTDVVHLEEKKLIQYKGGYTEFRRAHTARIREREKEVKKQQEDKKAGKKVQEEVEKIKDYVVKFRFLPPRGDDRGGISVHDVDFSYSGKKPWLLHGLNFRVDAESRIAVLGPNGAGKSTLLNLLAKLEEPCKGEIVHSRNLTVCRYSQHFDEIAPALRLSAVDFLTSPELRRFGAGTESPELAHKCLGQFGLPSHAHKRPMEQLSGGQKARVCFASITCRKPEILILDEPTNHLDIESVEALIDALKRFKGGLVLVSHDARLIQASGCDLWLCQAQEELVKVNSFEDYRRQVLKKLRERQELAEREAARRAVLRQKRRAEMLAKRKVK